MHLVILLVCSKLWCCTVPCADGPANIPDGEEISTSRRQVVDPPPVPIDKAHKIYEYGKRELGDRMSFTFLGGSIPAFRPIAILNASSEYPELRPEFTYLKVEYKNAWSEVNVTYDPEKHTINVYVQFPFLETTIGALGYSLPKESENT